ncbi:MAG: TIGR03668 family PPOX class F420-dependent oxidoreductase [Rhodospirillaceae bacterium]|nr:TIGR03668 family PPOX class F420-dependent oxidoreductase [Rhodospirillaceae bacterium]MDD9913766.1 TIGR03668 family PPOX class F420-dependent oxidoreductase [Rhodospirillaceae bacterium]MDD9928248.1 TIGR03668 family PPOX class F420-dependent oxidoreductase [Rhodospirillaceae bacterium]
MRRQNRLDVLTAEQLVFLEARRTATLATADVAGAPHALPVCFLADTGSVYIAIDQKPKSGDPRALKRLRNIAKNPQVALVADRYDDADWSRLGWVMVRGRAEILENGAEYTDAQARLTARYTQYQAMDLEGLPVIAIRIEKVTSWGALTAS